MMNAYKTIPLSEMKAQVSPEDRARVDVRTAQLIAEEQTLQDLRKAMGITQVQMRPPQPLFRKQR